MRLLLVKMSSLGDVVHSLPALTDALAARPDLEVHWLVEKSYADLVAMHPGVRQVWPIEFRRWRRSPWRSRVQWRTFLRDLRAQPFDLVLDAQGLLKSALVTGLARTTAAGQRAGLDWRSAREAPASWFYGRRYGIARGQHAVDRTRQLLAAALDYPLPTSAPDFGLQPPPLQKQNQVVFLHGTSWANKRWPEAYWRALAQHCADAGITVLLPWGNAEEQASAMRIATAVSGAQVLPAMSVAELQQVLLRSRALVSMDTGLGHLAAALGLPTLALYGPTNAALTGLRGNRLVNLQAAFPCAPCLRRSCNYQGPPVRWQEGMVEPACMAQLQPAAVWEQLQSMLANPVEPHAAND